MQNEFEKQVQQKMDELRFVPTPPVWDKIEAQIRKKKERRRFLFWLPLAVLCTGAACWWIAAGPAQTGQDNDRAAIHTAQNTTPQSKTTAAGGSTPSSSTESSTTQPATTQSSSNTITNTNTTATPDHTVTSSAENTSARTAATSKTLKENRINIRNNITTATSKAQRTRRSTTPASTRIHTGPESKAAKVNASTASSVEPAPVAASRPVVATVPPANNSSLITAPATIAPAVNSAAPAPKAQAVPTDTQAVVVAPIKKQGPPKAWRWGISAAAGWSGMGRGIGLSTSKSADLSYANPATPRVPLATYVDPSAPSRHAAFEIGLTAERRLTDRLSFAAGLGYSYFSTAIGSGERINTIALSVTPLTGVNYNNLNAAHGGSYVNRFHFVTLPVSVQLRPLARLPLELHAGITARRLVASDALLYNSELQVYYKDHSAFRKTQLFTGLGLDYTFAGKRSAWRAGPQFEYGLNRVQNDGRQHWYAFGLRLQYFRDK